MSRPVLCLDVTTFRSPQDRDRFLQWACRHVRTRSSPDAAAAGVETAASSMQSSGGPIQLVGAWREEPGSRAFTLYTCRDGWAGGWKDMLELYVGVPESLFLSAIDDVRWSATTLALVGTPDNPPSAALEDGSMGGTHGVLELMTVAAGDELEQLRRLGADAGRPAGFSLAGAFEIGYQDGAIAALWIADHSAGADDWRRQRGHPGDVDVEVIGLSAYPGPALSGSASAPVVAGRSGDRSAEPEHGH